jgi:hypothetical protein
MLKTNADYIIQCAAVGPHFFNDGGPNVDNIRDTSNFHSGACSRGFVVMKKPPIGGDAALGRGHEP